MVNIKDLTKIYVTGGMEVKAVDNVSLNIEYGDFIEISGHSGSGKTTLLSLIGGLTHPKSGSVIVEGINLWSLNDNKLAEFRNLKMNFIYQFSSLLPTLTALENVMLPTIFSKDKTDKTKLAKDLLERVGLSERFNFYPAQLSGGQQRRVAIARAFINSPQIILADEPTGDLDIDTEMEMINFFKEMRAERNITFVCATHSPNVARAASIRLRMEKGVLWKEL